MSLVGLTWSATLQATLAGVGMLGDKLPDFCNAVGNGSVNHVVGKQFTTTDVGSTPGSGNGSGTGINGLVQSNISNSIYAKCVSTFGQFGSKLQDFCDAVASACISEMAKATLSSTHSPVFLGSGVVDIGSIAVVGADWGLAIESAAPSFLGSQWPNMAKAMGEGQADEILASGTGTVTISGSGGTPVPGVGTGTGNIS